VYVCVYVCVCMCVCVVCVCVCVCVGGMGGVEFTISPLFTEKKKITLKYGRMTRCWDLLNWLKDCVLS